MFFCWASLPSELQIYSYNVRPGWPDRSRKSQATQKWCVESKGKDIRDFSQVSFIATLLHYQKNFRCLQQLPFWLRNPSLILQGSLSGTYPWMSPATIWSRFQSSCWQIFFPQMTCTDYVNSARSRGNTTEQEVRDATGDWCSCRMGSKKWFMLRLLTWWTWKLDKRNFRISRKNGCRCFVL